MLSEGHGHSLETAMRAELYQDVLDVVPNRRVADAQLVGDGRCCEAAGDQAENFPFSGRQGFSGSLPAPPR